MADLCDLQDVKVRHRIKSDDTRWDALITAWIPAASAAVEAYAGGQQFSRDDVASTRVYTMTTSGEVVIDNLAEPPTAVTLHDQVTGALVEDLTAQVVTEPRNLPAGGTRPITTLTFRTATIRDGAEIHVTGLWGCPSVPLVVKEAVIWTVRDWLREAQAVVDEAPDIEPGSAGPAGRGIPARAQMLLDKVYDWRVPE